MAAAAAGNEADAHGAHLVLIRVYLSDATAKDSERVTDRIREFASNIDCELLSSRLEEVSSLVGEFLLKWMPNPAKLFHRLHQAFCGASPETLIRPIGKLLQDYQNAVVLIGTVLVVKKTDENGRSDLAYMELSDTQVQYLGENPALIQQPFEIQERLHETASADNKALQADRPPSGD